MSNVDNFSLQSFIAGAERNARASLLPPGYFAKQNALATGDVFNATYGRRVWDALNNQTRFWNIIRKVQFGPTVGWRLRTDRGEGRSNPVTEPLDGYGMTGNNFASGNQIHSLPTIDVSNYERIDSPPRIVASDFGVSLLGQVMSGLEGGMGDNLAVEQEAAARDHIKELNQELLLRGYAKINDTGSAEAVKTVDTTAISSFRRGDSVRITTDGTVRRVIGTSGNTVTLSANVAGNEDGEVIYVTGRGGFTSLDDVVHQDGVALGGVAGGAAGVNIRAYNMPNLEASTLRNSGHWSAGRVLANSGVGRELTLPLLDSAIRHVRERGADPDVILMNYDQYDKLNSLLQANQRYLEWQEFQVKMGDDTTLPGTHAGFQVASYRGIPVFVDPDVAHGISSAGAELGGNIYVMDTRYLEIAIAAPTQYVDNRDFFQANTFILRGLFYTMGEFRSYRFDTNVKITDLNA